MACAGRPPSPGTRAARLQQRRAVDGVRGRPRGGERRLCLGEVAQRVVRLALDLRRHSPRTQYYAVSIQD